MSYQVLARKWRPQHFAQLVGQEHVKNALGNALTNNRLHHAYLFTGTRGVGKTTIARIFAKSLNCEQGITATPCGQCSACLEIDAGNFVDLLEIDAASRTKVEDTRDLLDNVQYAPSRGRFKVYLIDEVHMLSRHSFNALLKTLEEPPPHVKFLLATTDPQKLPVTVLSRCLQFNLLALSPQQIEQHLSYVLTEEQVPFAPPALTMLARAAKGSLRDSLSLTDQAIAQSNADISVESVRAMLGLLEQSWAEQLLLAILAQDITQLQTQLAALVQQQSNFSQVLDDMLTILHLVALTQFSPAAAAFSEQQPVVQQLADTLAPAQVQLYYQLLISGKKELPYAPDPLTGLQMALLRAMVFVPEVRQNLAAPPVPAAVDMVAVKPAASVPVPWPQDVAPIPAPGPAVATTAEIAVTAPAQTETAAAGHSAGGIDAVTARIMARRGVQVTAAPEPKKPERQQAPAAVAEPDRGQISPPANSLMSKHTAPEYAVAAAEAAPAQAEQQAPYRYDAEEPDDAMPQYDAVAADALWQQYEQEVQQEPQQGLQGSGQAPATELAQFDGSINEQNFSVRFAAQVDAWAARVETLDTGGLSRLFLLNAAMQLDGNNLSLVVAQSQQHLDNPAFRTQLQQVLEHSFNQPLTIDISYQHDVAQSPLSIQQNIVQERQGYVSRLLQQDEKVLQLQQLFHAELLPATLKVN